MTDEVGIANLALQKLGAKRITSLTEDSRNARAVNACYEAMRDLELRAHTWNFTRAREQLAADPTAPAFDFNYAYPLPNDFLRAVLPSQTFLDWQIERHQGVRAILSNDSGPLNLRYIAKVTDPTEFDPCFVDALACRNAWQICEELTQSNEKKNEITQQYKDSISKARQVNALETPPEDAPVDSWDVARLPGGSSRDLNFLSGYLGG